MYVFFFVLAVIILITGVILVISELETEEAEVLGPAAIVCLILGAILWFMSNPTTWLLTFEWFTILTIIILAVVISLSGFCSFLTYKIIKLKKELPEVKQFVGGTGRTIDKVTWEEEGYIHFHGELWKARSKIPIKKDQKVRVIGKEDLTLIIEPLDLYCPNCEAKLDPNTTFCTNCGMEVRNSEN